MDMEKNLTGTVDSEKNEIITSGRNKAKKIRRSNNHPIKVTLFRLRNESKIVTGAGYGTGGHEWVHQFFNMAADSRPLPVAQSSLHTLLYTFSVLFGIYPCCRVFICDVR
jgi:hypothetical protein